MKRGVPPFATPTLLHNPGCSKSRAAKALLDGSGFAYQERRYLDQPLSLVELRELRARLDLPAREWLRVGEKAFQEAALVAGVQDDETILNAMARFPILIERPILILGDRAVVGRPPERIVQLIDQPINQPINHGG